MKFLKVLSMTVLLTPTFAIDESRPKSSGEDSLLEVTIGQVKVGSHEVFEAGLDYEFFLPGWEHHLSFGVATEVEFLKSDEFYLGPLVSFYYFHTKAFFTSGFQTDFNKKSYWKNRIGLGYEYFIQKDLIIVPTIAIDRGEGDYHRALSIGFAWEF